MIDFDRLRGWLLGLMACAIITLLVGCRSTKYVPVENVRTEYKDRVVTVHDTVRDSVRMFNNVYRHDSMAVMMRGGHGVCGQMAHAAAYQMGEGYAPE